MEKVQAIKTTNKIEVDIEEELMDFGEFFPDPKIFYPIIEGTVDLVDFKVKYLPLGLMPFKIGKNTIINNEIYNKLSDELKNKIPKAELP